MGASNSSVKDSPPVINNSSTEESPLAIPCLMASIASERGALPIQSYPRAHLLSIPLEIRLEIYSYIFTTPSFRPNPSIILWDELPKMMEVLRDRYKNRMRKGANLLRVNGQIRDEIGEVFSKYVTVHWPSKVCPCYASILLASCSERTKLLVRSISIGLSWSQDSKLQERQRVRERLCEILQADLPNLRHVVFKISFIGPEFEPDARRQCLDNLVGFASIFSEAQRVEFSQFYVDPRGEPLSWDILRQRNSVEFREAHEIGFDPHLQQQREEQRRGILTEAAEIFAEKRKRRFSRPDLNCIESRPKNISARFVCCSEEDRALMQEDISNNRPQSEQNPQLRANLARLETGGILEFTWFQILERRFPGRRSRQQPSW